MASLQSGGQGLDGISKIQRMNNIVSYPSGKLLECVNRSLVVGKKLVYEGEVNVQGGMWSH